jgi:hypothetical protein
MIGVVSDVVTGVVSDVVTGIVSDVVTGVVCSDITGVSVKFGSDIFCYNIIKEKKYIKNVLNKIKKIFIINASNIKN